MPTRIRCTTGAAGVTPDTWLFPDQVTSPVTVPGTTDLNTGLAMTSQAGATIAGGAAHFRAMGRTIWGPLAAQTISGTVIGQIRAMESNAAANATLALAIKLVQPSGADRSVLLDVAAADNTGTSPPEIVVNTLTNRRYQDVTEATTLTLTAQTATAGDYLVIEWGFRAVSASSRTITLSYGNDSATDLATGGTETTALNPWWEFSGTLTLGEGAPTVSASETVPVTALAALLVPLLPLSAASTVGLLSSVSLALSPLRPLATETVTAADTPTVALRLAPVSLSTTLALTDTPIVVQTAEGALAVGPVTTSVAVTDAPTLRLPLLSAAVLTALGLMDVPTVHVPVLSLARAESLALGTTATVQIPLLRLSVTESLGVNASATVVRTVEGLVQVGQVLEALATTTTVTLRLPFLSVSAGSSLAVGALPTMHSDVGTLHPETGVSLATAVTMHLRLLVQTSETLPVLATSSLGGTSVFLTTTTVGLGTTAAVALRLHVLSTESLPLATQGTLHLRLAPQASDGVTLGETLTLTGVLRLTSTSALSLETTAAFSVGLLYVLAIEEVALTAISFRVTGLSLRGLHAQTPALRQAAAADPTLEQAEVADAVLV